MAKTQERVSIRTAIDLLAAELGEDEAISELFNALRQGAVKVEAVSWILSFDFTGRSLSEHEMDEIRNGAKAAFWDFMRDQMLGGPTDGYVRHQSFNRGNFDVMVRYGSAANANHEISGLSLCKRDVESLLAPTNAPVSSRLANSKKDDKSVKTISKEKLKAYVIKLKIDTKINRSEVPELAKSEFKEYHVPRKMVREVMTEVFGRGTPGPKKRPN